MAVYLACGNLISFLQEANQLLQCQLLTVGGFGLGEIPDETDTNAGLVGPVVRCTPAVSACNLLSPSKCHFDLAVCASPAVADDKIIANAVPAFDLPMVLIEHRHIAYALAGMMNNNRFPTSFLAFGQDPVRWILRVGGMHRPTGRHNRRRRLWDTTFMTDYYRGFNRPEATADNNNDRYQN